jgi:hypothetical protein
VSADDVSIVQGPRGVESAKEVSAPDRSARNRRRRVRFQVTHARGDGSPWRGHVKFDWTWWLGYIGERVFGRSSVPAPLHRSDKR